MCGADFWGGRSNDLIKNSETSITVSAVTAIHHSGTHSSCSGTFEALPFLQKYIHPNGPWTELCTGYWENKLHTTSGSNTDVWKSASCTSLSEGWYRSGGRHKGFGEGVHTSEDQMYTDLDGEGGMCPGQEAEVAACQAGESTWWDFEECTCVTSPIIIDVSGDGFRLTNTANGVLFDLDSDGAPEPLPWTAVGTDDGWLVLDRNGNGVIDNGTELFGNFSPQPESPQPNGFLALQVFDANGDGWIDRADPVLRRLRLWVDADHDGISRASELLALAGVGLTRISVRYRESRRTDEWGNIFRYRARVDGANGIGRWAFDVFLRVAPMR